MVFAAMVMAMSSGWSGKRAEAALVRVSMTNHGNSSFFLTPVWFGFHNGSFDTFNPGSPANSSLEELAEDGIVGGLNSDFMNMLPLGTKGVLANAAGFGGAPIIDPGETATLDLAVDTIANRFFSYATMVIPSNDSFLANPAPILIFDAQGNISGGTFSFSLFQSQIWDAGTEVNDTLGAAFSLIGGVSTTQQGNVTLLPDGGLNNFLNSSTPAGMINNPIDPGELVASFSITNLSTVPEPSSFACLSLMSVGALVWGWGRRRRRVASGTRLSG